MNKLVTSVSELEAHVGKTPGPMKLKVIDHLDNGALQWIAASPIAFVSFADQSAIDLTLGGGRAGFAIGDSKTLRLPKSALDRPELAHPGKQVGSVFLIPSIREVLRVNGIVDAVTDEEIIVTVKECYGHCGKSLIRSEFWFAQPSSESPADIKSFSDTCRFMALASIDDKGYADVSPKGDPAGSMAFLDNDILWFADRPGNKRTDSFRNIITQPKVAALLMIPGSSYVVHVSGIAQITTDETERERFSVQNKVPKVAICIKNITIEMSESPALNRANLWPAEAAPDNINPGKLFLDHLKLNKNIGVKVIGAALSSVSGLVQKGLEDDYKKNLY
ncbi:MAG: pyridoxamine 5-phosphate oxidase [SAR86 cluster bacterium]|uniref:Pyridoxamine 5-phosphate oxidase n=1 Tax=SAR86 cluster bacterium TaxID=2030880 RepID=A0A2A5AWN0_9GAMM|nr:MAG: pyridoxamine 5-phosphate oxidase [SAR86 cluster bacterium]